MINQTFVHETLVKILSYVRYLIAKQCGLKEIPYITQEDRVNRSLITYVMGMVKNRQNITGQSFSSH